ncbi:LytR/AlgR family response regulator transcription factor [Undibacterium danionis]|uniref:LytR/AlgR family response regulator transcription factor n=1 Tax=Undibacterium danionis TaxID=1812100 RepID=A0ABV6IHI9_9BURK
MTMFTAIIAEDEPLLAQELREALAALWPGLQIIAECTDGITALRTIQNQTPDIVFLDINMPQLTGLEVARVIQGKTSIVFLTAYNQHALDAFELGAVDYLVKPLQRGRLLTTIERLRAKTVKSAADIPDTVWDKVTPTKSETKHLRWIQASVGNLLRLITIDEIYFFQSDAKYTRVVTAQQEALIRKPIKELIDELNPEDFIQISRGAIVNLRRIESIYREDGHMEIRLKDRSERLAVSTGYQAAFKQM